MTENKLHNLMNNKSIYLILILILLIANLVFTITIHLRANKNGTITDETKAINFANDLVNNGLYKQATVEFQRLIDNPSIDNNKRINLFFILGNIYMDNLNDYENALKTYIQAKTFYPDNQYNSDIQKRIITCLERLGKSVEAQAALQQATQINSSGATPQGKIIASVGNRKITMNDINQAINELPDSLKYLYSSPQAKLDFIRNNLIVRELLYNYAQRKGFDRDQNYIQRQKQIEKNLLIQMAYESEFKETPKISESDLRLFYDAKKDSLYKGKKFDEIKQQVANDYLSSKQGEFQSKLIQKLVAGESVEIYPESLGIAGSSIKFGGDEK